MTFGLRDLRDYFDSGAASRRDATANFYGVAAAEEIAALYDEVTREILDLLQPQAEASILDIGCGTGEVLARIAACCPRIVGIDLSPAMVRMVTDRGYKAVAYDGSALPFENAAFDAVLIYQVLINLPNRESVETLLDEAVRVTRPGGRIFVGAVPHPEWSGFPTHERAWWVAAKIAARRHLLGQATIPYFSYPYAFFDRFVGSRKLRASSFVRCRVSRSGWATKYHAILTR